jgi:signal transduction histidine kinase
MGYGLPGLKERAEILNGSVDIQSIRERGTDVIIKVPINNERD